MPSARPGVAKGVVVFNNERHRGKTLLGTLTFTANGKRVTRAFSLRV